MSHFRLRENRIEVSFSDGEKLFLGDVLPFLATVGTPGVDPAADRLNVPVYLNDPDSNQEWWRLMGKDLEEGRRADRVVFRNMLTEEGRTMDIEQGNAVLRVLNEARLALGARMGLDVEEDHDSLPEESRQTLDYLGWIQEELTNELTKAL